MENELFQAFARAAWTGETGALPKWLVRFYQEAGASHVLALSGQHVNAFVWLLVLGLRGGLWTMGWVTPRFAERLSDSVADKLPLIAAGILLLLSELSASVLRSFVMVFSFWILSRRALFASPLQKLGSSLAVVILLFPTRASETGFILSGAMTTWLILLNDRSSARETFQTYFSLSVSLSLLAMPLSLYFFGGVSWASPLWNLVLAPLWDIALIPILYATSLLVEIAFFAPLGTCMEYCLKFFVEFHRLLEPWVSASYVLLPRPNLMEMLCVEVWLFCIVSKFRNAAPSIDFS